MYVYVYENVYLTYDVLLCRLSEKMNSNKASENADDALELAARLKVQKVSIYMYIYHEYICMYMYVCVCMLTCVHTVCIYLYTFN